MLRRLLAASLVGGVITACQSTTDTGPHPAHVIVTPDTVTINQKGSATLTVQVTDKNDELIVGAVVSFSSANPQMVTVSNLGVITSVGPAGTTNVIVKSGAASLAVPVTVTPVTSGITVTPDPATLDQKTTLQLHAQVTDAVGAPVPNAPITYSSGNLSMLTVSTAGLIQSVGPAGTTTITLSSGSVSRTLNVTINQVPTDLRVAPTSVLLGQHGQVQLSANVVDAVGSIIPNAPMTYSTPDQTVITVSSTGLVTSVGPTGTSSVTVKSGAFTKTIPVQVATLVHPSATSVTTTSFNGAWGIGISSTGTIIAPSSDGQNTVRVDAASGALTPISGITGGIDVAFSTDGKFAYVANTGQNRIDVVDVASNTVTGSFPTVQPIAVQVSRDNQTLFVGSSGVVVAYDLVTKAEKGRVTGTGTVNAIARHPTQDLLYASGFDAGIVTEINSATATMTRSFHIQGTVQQPVVSVDGNTLYVALEGGDLAFVDLTSGALQPTMTGAGGFGAALTPDGTQLWVVSGATLKIVDPVGRTMTTFTLPGGGRRVVFSPDGSVGVITEEGAALMFVR